MSWPEWNLGIPRELARFVNAQEVLRKGLRPTSAGDLAADPSALAAAVYETIRERRLSYSSTVLGDRGNQLVQTPAEVLATRTPNCVDLTAMFAGACLASDLVVLIGIVSKADNTRHSLAWVVPNANTRARRFTDLGRVGGDGVISCVGREACIELLDNAAGQGWIPIETTGVCESSMWAEPDGAPESISFQRAVAVATEVLDGATRIEIVDVDRLQAEGLRPHEPPELTDAIRNRRLKRLTVAGLAAVLLVVAGLVAWRPWAGVVELRTMEGEFNVAVARLASSSDDRAGALSISNEIAGQVRDGLDEQARFLVWGPEELGSAVPDDARQLADQIGAQLLVHGTYRSQVGPADVVFQIEAAQFSRRSPFPLTISEEFEVAVTTDDVNAGALGQVPAISSFVLTVDAITALIADRPELAEERLDQAIELRGSQARPVALIPALRAWMLLVRASIDADPDLVREARTEVDRALEIDPESEFARLTKLSALYLEIVPAPIMAVDLSCSPPLPELPTSEDVARVRNAVLGEFDSFSPMSQVQARSLLGRLEASDAVIEALASGNLDLQPATDEFAAIIDAFENDADSVSLRIWAADAHRWLGLLAAGSGGAPSQVATHLVDAADIATPYFASLNHGTAGLIHLCDDRGSCAAALDFFRTAARESRGRTDDDADARAYEQRIADIEQGAGSSPTEGEPCSELVRG